MSRYGIETSILVRLCTGSPKDSFARSVRILEELHQRGAEVFVGALVVSEAFFVLQHHYGLAARSSAQALARVLGSGYVAPVPIALRTVLEGWDGQGAGLMDRLIAVEGVEREWTMLTLDKAMSRLPSCRLLGRRVLRDLDSLA